MATDRLEVKCFDLAHHSLPKGKEGDHCDRMGKHKRRRRFGIPVRDGHPGCLWGLFYQHWRNAKKRLPHRRNSDDGQGNAGDKGSGQSEASNADNLVATGNSIMENSNVEEKVRQAAQKNKNSVRARIKALIKIEVSKRKGRHRRTSTYPVESQLMQADSIDILKTSDEDPLNEIVLKELIAQVSDENHENPYASSSIDSKLSKSSEDCITTGKSCKNGHFDEKDKKQQIEEHLNNMKQKEITADASPHRSKEFLEALDIVNLNKDYFLKVLHDPGSPLALHFHNKQALSAKMRLTRSETFPIPSLSGRREEKLQVGGEAKKLSHSESMDNIRKQSIPLIAAENRAGGIRKPEKPMSETCESSTPGSTHRVKNQVKQFKDIKQKIKHEMKEGKTESQRITMDAFLHKIPHGPGFSADLSKEFLYQLNDSSSIRNFGKESGGITHWSDVTSNIGKSRHHGLRRTSSSLSETLDRYRRLYDTSVKQEDKTNGSDRTNLRGEELPQSSSNQRSLGRILSLPELRSYFYQTDESPDVCSSGMAFKTSTDGTISISSIDEDKVYEIPLASEYCFKLDTCLENQIQENVKVSGKDSVGSGHQVGSRLFTYGNANANSAESFYENSDFKTRENEFEKVQDLGPVTHKLEGSVVDSKIEEDTESTTEFSMSQGYTFHNEHDSLSGSQHGSRNDSEKVETQSKHVGIDISQLVQVDTKDKANFDYVRNILELSGFSGYESLGTWHSDIQPLDPSVFEEVEGCILLDPCCSGNEGGNCNHLLLFDLINEVLMEIYERSYSYCPMPLSSLSRIHPMPAGHHVLEEVWAYISRYLRMTPEVDDSLDNIVSRDLAKNGWLNLQFDAECVGMELEGLIFEELLEEVIISI